MASVVAGAPGEKMFFSLSAISVNFFWSLKCGNNYKLGRSAPPEETEVEFLQAWWKQKLFEKELVNYIREMSAGNWYK